MAVGVPVKSLQGQLNGDYVLLTKSWPGVTLVVDMAIMASVVAKVPPKVLVITLEQEEAGVRYDGSVPFVVEGKKVTPKAAGVFFHVPGTEYAVRAWGDARGTTSKMRALMTRANKRLNKAKESAVIDSVEAYSSRSYR